MNRQLLFLLFSLTLSFFNSSFSMVYRPYYSMWEFLHEIKDPEKRQIALYEKGVEVIRECLEKDIYIYNKENIKIFLSNMKSGAQVANLDKRLLFEQLKEFVMQEMIRYAAPHNHSSYNAAKWAIGLGIIVVIGVGAAYLFYQKNKKPLSDKLYDIEKKLRKMGATIREEVVTEQAPDYFFDINNPSLYNPFKVENAGKISHYRTKSAYFEGGLSREQCDCVEGYVAEYHKVNNQLEACPNLEIIGLMMSVPLIPFMMRYACKSFDEWAFSYDKKRYQLLSFMRDEIDVILSSL